MLVVSESREWPIGVQELVASFGIEMFHATDFRQARDPALLAKVDAVLVIDSTEPGLSDVSSIEIQLLADALISHRLMGVVLSPGTAGVVPGDDDALVIVPIDVSADELWGRLAMIRQYRPLLHRMEEQVAVMQRLGKKLNQHFVEVDQELRLASRLQRDFLPKTFPEINDVRFRVLYRPASWVSGDVYDIRRLDETYISFYLADAVGHGVAAGLLTMFIKQAIIGKRVHENDYTIVNPSEVLAKLNYELAIQELPNCQFVTACYAIINTSTYELAFARGGHPHPVHVNADGGCTEVRTVGGLLGVFESEGFQSTSLVLQPGEKFIIYSDGLEDMITSRKQRGLGEIRFTPEFQEIVIKPGEEFLTMLDAHINASEGSIQPEDDQSCLVVERLP